MVDPATFVEKYPFNEKLLKGKEKVDNFQLVLYVKVGMVLDMERI